MPKQQETFKLVPATLVKNTAPRRAMTSKEAKKVYREASKVPKLSKAEQRRIDAAEIARQKKEYERERAAAKARAMREKKLKKDAEEKEKRKRMGLPEPNRYVRPSQSTIKGFVSVKVGQKRTLDEVDSMADESMDTCDELSKYDNVNHKHESSPQIIEVPRGMDEEDDFGVFPSMSQVDVPDISNVINSYLHSADPMPSGTSNLQELAQAQQRGLLSTIPASSYGSQNMKITHEALQHDSSNNQNGLRMIKFETNKQDDEDDFGDFPSLSQIDVLDFDIANNHSRRGWYQDRKIPITSNEFLTLPVDVHPIHEKDGEFEFVERAPEAQKSVAMDETVKGDWPANENMICEEWEEQEVREKRALNLLASGQVAVPFKTGTPATPKNTQRGGQIYRNISSLTTFAPSSGNLMLASVTGKDDELSPNPDTVPRLFKAAGGKSMGTPLALQQSLTPNSFRKPLEELSSNVSPLIRRQGLKPTGSMFDIGGNEVRSVRSKKAARKMQSSSFIPPSTLAFLETHLDDFFPSPSQQIRELVEDIDDIPTNTQIARDIDGAQSAGKGPTQVLPPHPQSQSIGAEDGSIHMLSSQVIEIISQDLGETFTGNKIETCGFQRLTSTARDLGLVEIPNPPPSPELPKTRTKPRFFEEKEEDLLIGALHESLLMAKKQSRSSSPRRSQRIAQSRRETEVEFSKDDFDSDGFETDPDLLAVLDEVESRSLRSSRV